MADDGVIKIGTSVDVSGLQAGMQQAQQAVQRATSNMQEAYDLLGKSAALGNQQAQATLKSYEQELGAAQQAVAAFAASERAESSALQASVSARMAATAELRVFEGNLTGSTRAAGALLSSLPGLGVAMQAAFPVFGAIALIGVVDSLGKKMYEAFDLGGERARKTEEDIRNLSLEIDRSTSSLNVQIDRLQQEQARLEHKPFNGIKLALDEAAEAAGKLAQQLDAVAERERKVIAGMAASGPQQALGLGSGTDYEQTMVREHARHLDEAKTAQDQLNESTSYYMSLQTRLKELEAKQAVASQQSEGVGLNFTNEIEATKQLISWQQQEQAQIKATIALNDQQKTTQTARDNSEQQRLAQEAARKATEAERKAQEAAIQAARQGLDERKSVEDLSALQEAQYWEAIASTATYGSKLYTTAVDQANKALAQAQKQNQELSSRVGSEMEESWTAATRAADEAKKKQQELANALGAAADRISAAQQKASESAQEASLHALEASGAISKLAAAQEEARIHAQAYREELARLDAEITRVSQDAALTPQQRTQQVGQLQAQQVQVQGQANASAINDQAAIQQQISAPYLKAFAQINQGWLQVQNQMLFSTRNLGVAFAKMGQQMAISVIDGLEKMALEAIEKSLVMRLVHQEMVTANLATDRAGAAASTAISKTTTMEQGIQAAKLAFQNTYANVSQWPVVGPILAPVLASAAFVAVAAFEEGTGYVPRDGMAYLHQGEAVVPAPTMEQLRGGGDGAGSSFTINQHNNWNGMTDRQFKQQLYKHASDVVGAAQKHARQSGRA